jgi:hypothetical protein
MSGLPKCCPHCSADVMPIGKPGLCWLCRKPLFEETLAYAAPPAATLPSSYSPAPPPEPVAVPAPPDLSAPAELAEPLLPPAELIRNEAPYEAVDKSEFMATVVSLLIGLGAVIVSSSLSGIVVGLSGAIAAYLASQAKYGPLKVVGRVFLIAGLCVAAVFASVIALVVVCTIGLALHSAVQ